MNAYTRVRNSIQSLQHRSHDHRILHLKIMRHANGEHLHRDDLTTTPAARRAVHARVARDEELGELVHEFARCHTATAHETGTLWERGDQLRPTRRGESRCAQLVVSGKVTVELRSFRFGMGVKGRASNATYLDPVSQSIGRMPIGSTSTTTSDKGADVAEV